MGEVASLGMSDSAAMDFGYVCARARVCVFCGCVLLCLGLSFVPIQIKLCEDIQARPLKSGSVKLGKCRQLSALETKWRSENS